MAADHTFKPTVNEESDFDRDEIIEELADAGHKRARLKKMDDAELVKLHEREFSEEEDDEEPRVSTVNTEISVLEVESSLELLTEELRLVLASAGVDRKHLLQADLKSLIASSIKLIDENLLDD